VGLERGLAAVDLATGHERWLLKTGAPVRYPMVCDGVAYLACEKLIAADARTGEPKWSRTVFTSANPQVCLADGALFLGARYEDGITLIDARTGEVKNRIQAESGKYDRALRVYRGPTVTGGVLCCQAMNSWAPMGIDSNSKAILWQRPQGLSIPVHTVPHYAPVVVDGILYLPGGQSVMTAVQ